MTCQSHCTQKPVYFGGGDPGSTGIPAVQRVFTLITLAVVFSNSACRRHLPLIQYEKANTVVSVQAESLSPVNVRVYSTNREVRLYPPFLLMAFRSIPLRFVPLRPTETQGEGPAGADGAEIPHAALLRDATRGAPGLLEVDGTVTERLLGSSRSEGGLLGTSKPPREQSIVVKAFRAKLQQVRYRVAPS